MNLKEKLIYKQIVVDNESLDKYVQLIEKNYVTPNITFITQKHHIIPRYYFKTLLLDVDNSRDNIVNLSLADHILAHYYLMQCSATTWWELANANAIFKLTNFPNTNDLEHWVENNRDLLQQISIRRNQLISLHHADVSDNNNPRAQCVYEYSCEGTLLNQWNTIKECAKDNNISPDGFRAQLSKNRVIIRDKKLFSKYFDITIEEISNAIAQKTRVSERKRTKHCYICDICGKKLTKLICECDWLNYLQSDAPKLCHDCNSSQSKSDKHKQSISESHKGLKWIHNNTVQKQVPKSALPNYLSQGWVLGQLKK